ncbi:hypothetical protein GCM10020331_039120 [Ectobacillus funiculus]
MSKIPNGHEIISLFETMYPKAFAMEGDPIGLHIGALNRPVTNVLIALDVTEEVVDEAIEKQAGLIIAHHPLVYRPLKKRFTQIPLMAESSKSASSMILPYMLLIQMLILQAVG